MSTSESTCLLCSIAFPTNELLIIGKCNHFFCGECLVNYVTKNLKPRMKCPSQLCDESIRDPVLRKCLSNDQIVSYENLCVIGSSSKATKCPIRECPFLYIYEEKGGVFICEYCESPICITCNDIHYPGVCGISEEEKAVLRENARTMIRARRREESKINDTRYDLLPNPVGFKCSFCTDFILPRCGVILRNCLDCFCRNCLEATYTNKNFTNQMKCQTCNAKLENKELVVLIEEKKFTSMVKNETMSRWFHCKEEYCVGVWDMQVGSKTHTCHLCGSVNCLTCCAVHTGMSCEAYQKLPEILASISEMNKLKAGVTTTCHYCQRILFQNKSSGHKEYGALYCDTCGHHTCEFTGKIAGRHDVKVCGCWNSKHCEKVYCECTATKPCDAKCLYGCFPE